MTDLWNIVEEKTNEGWLQLQDPDGFFHAYVKFDGCVGYTRYDTVPNDEAQCDDIHICDLDREIERLQALKELALKHFGPDWPR